MPKQNLMNYQWRETHQARESASGHDKHLLVASQTVHVVKRRIPCEHFEHNAAEAPPISRESMASSFDDFWAHVERAADGGVSAAVFLQGHNDAAVEITNADEAVLIE